MDRDVKAYRGENIVVSTRVLPTFSIRPDLSKTQWRAEYVSGCSSGATHPYR
jgi:hypothetical protein